MSDTSFPHDAIYKKLFSHPEMVASLLRDFVPEPFGSELDSSTLVRLSGEFVGKGFTRGAGDSIWKLRWREKSWCYVALLLEFQSSPDPRMPIRLMVYTGQLLLRLMDEDKTLRPGHLPAVLPIVLYTGEGPWNVHRSTLDTFAPEARAQCLAYLPDLRYILVDERRLDATREEIRDGLMALVARFVQARTDEDVPGVLADMERVLDGVGNPELSRVFIELVRYAFLSSGVPGNWSEQVNTFGEVRTMFNMEQWKENWLAQGMERGLAQGMERGMERGMQRGRFEEKRSGVARMLAMGKFSLEEIAQIFELELDEVRAIAEAERGKAD